MTALGRLLTDYVYRRFRPFAFVAERDVERAYRVRVIVQASVQGAMYDDN
jgi:hypothetical protein